MSETVTVCTDCDGIGGDEKLHGWEECSKCESAGFLVNGRAATFDEYMRLTGARLAVKVSR